LQKSLINGLKSIKKNGCPPAILYEGIILPARPDLEGKIGEK
jgi:hypothetical protein